MIRKPLDLPAAVARPFVKDMGVMKPFYQSMKSR